jgi:cytochrome c
MNRRTAVWAIGLVMAACCQGMAGAAEQYASKEEAKAMVKKAVAYIKANGRDKAFAEFSDPKGSFVDRELYVSVFDMNGVNLAHGSNKKIIGKNMMEYRDPDGKYPIKEGLKIAKGTGSGWYDFRFLNPTNKEMQTKTIYIERYEDLAIWVGAYL